MSSNSGDSSLGMNDDVDMHGSLIPGKGLHGIA